MKTGMLVLAAATWLLAPAAVGQSIARAYAGKDGKAHLEYAGGRTRIIPPEEEQAGCDHVSVAEDGRTAGWSVLIKNPETSYPSAIAVVLYRDGKKTVIATGQMISQWRFVGRGERVAVLSGPVHGYAAEALLVDSRSGKRLQAWNGQGTVPDWAKGWEEEFQD